MPREIKQTVRETLHEISKNLAKLVDVYARLSELVACIRHDDDPLSAFWRMESINSNLQIAGVEGLAQGIGENQEVLNICRDIAGHSEVLSIMAELSFRTLVVKQIPLCAEMEQHTKALKDQVNILSNLLITSN
jgi:hypothetical protein